MNLDQNQDIRAGTSLCILPGMCFLAVIALWSLELMLAAVFLCQQGSAAQLNTTALQSTDHDGRIHYHNYIQPDPGAIHHRVCIDIEGEGSPGLPTAIQA